MEATLPTLKQFTEACREEFNFLIRDHGFAEIAPPSAQYQNPFEVHFARAGWSIVISGVSCGLGASLLIRDPRRRTAGLWHIVPQDFFRTHRDGLGQGQLGDIIYCALTLRTFGAQFLAGDTSVFEELVRRREAYVERDRLEIESWPYQRAARDASAAFARHDYREVVRLLSPYTECLSEIERRKLNYAQRH